MHRRAVEPLESELPPGKRRRGEGRPPDQKETGDVIGVACCKKNGSGISDSPAEGQQYPCCHTGKGLSEDYLESGLNSCSAQGVGNLLEFQRDHSDDFIHRSGHDRQHEQRQGNNSAQ